MWVTFFFYFRWNLNCKQKDFEGTTFAEKRIINVSCQVIKNLEMLVCHRMTVLKISSGTIFWYTEAL